ncbi:hypothetical protein BDV93DRAFT_603948 [Ceratobasidium sp. AG-I]|nr:hypothetical protein BDV93DRAFT_603948 [Ceratobasidium sp. AG-I]
MFSALIQLFILLLVVCVYTAAEPFRRSTQSRIQQISNDLAAAKRPPSSGGWRRGTVRPHTIPHTATTGAGAGAGGDVKLLDIVLAASIDGHFHALNRTTGELIWSMTDDLSYVQSPKDPNTDSIPPIASQSPLYNLVRSDHKVLLDSDYDEDEETYVVEPQTGDIFVMEPFASADTPVERLGYSVPQIVELSPFKPPGDDERMFIGKKTTSLISLDLLTGRILGVYGERCTWDDNESGEVGGAGEVDVDTLLDDLDGTKEIPKKQRPVEVVIGRTDYHLSVHVKGKGVVQNLSFTKYGPNNVHRSIQSAWTRSPDTTYFQPGTDGKLFSFANGGILRVEYTYPMVVAVFDAVFLPTKRDPILLLQPTPRLSDLSTSSTADMDAREVTFVGRVDDSLFALSHTRYPLVVFTTPGKKSLPRIEDGGKTLPKDSQSAERCLDLDCFVGTRLSQTAARSGLSRLLEDAHTLLIEGSAGVEDAPGVEFDGGDEIASRSRSQPQSQSPKQVQTETQTRNAQKPGTIDAPRPTRTTNTTSHARPHVHVDEPSKEAVPEATPSHRTSLRALASEWVAAWAGMSGVILSSIMFGLGLGVRKGRGKVWKVFGARFGEEVKGPSSEDVPSPALEEKEKEDEGEEEEDTPPPVPPKPYSLSKMNVNPYHITDDSRPPPPPKEPAGKRIRPRKRSGLPGSVSAIVLPTINPSGKLNRSISTGDINAEEENPEETEQEEPVQDVELKQDEKVEAVTKKKVRRGGRGRRGKGKSKEEDVGSGGDGAEEGAPGISGALSEGSESFVKIEKAAVARSSLVLSEDVLGYGSHGTVVYKGQFQGRSVAVKRLLHDFVTLAEREVDLLKESDDHPNVIRYYYQERRENFLYIALELCPCSLADLVERPAAHPTVSGSFDAKRALGQVTAGLKHLHALKIVHRDIKPQNILVSARGAMLISDFGLCRKLEVDQTSFMPTVWGGAAAGTAGWRAPEILRGEVKLDEPGLDVSSGGTGGSSSGGTNGSAGAGVAGMRLTRSVDVFALGCLFFYVLSGGDHAYGERYERDINIMRNQKRLEWLERLGEEGMEAIDLIGRMLSFEPKARPDTTACLMHPFFWNPGRRLAFLQDASDRFEIMERDPREPGLVALETGAFDIIGADWQRKLDKMFIDNLGKFRKYDVKSVQDLLRALRNKKNHYQDLPDNVKRHLGPLPEGFLSYFTRRYPKLFLHVYSVVADSPLRRESMFRSYFVLDE